MLLEALERLASNGSMIVDERGIEPSSADQQRVQYTVIEETGVVGGTFQIQINRV